MLMHGQEQTIPRTPPLCPQHRPRSLERLEGQRSGLGSPPFRRCQSRITRSVSWTHGVPFERPRRICLPTNATSLPMSR